MTLCRCKMKRRIKTTKSGVFSKIRVTIQKHLRLNKVTIPRRRYQSLAGGRTSERISHPRDTKKGQRCETNRTKNVVIICLFCFVHAMCVVKVVMMTWKVCVSKVVETLTSLIVICECCVVTCYIHDRFFVLSEPGEKKLIILYFLFFCSFLSSN